MDMNRRSFFGSLAALTAGMALDPERLLWVPGQKTIFLPPRLGFDQECLRMMLANLKFAERINKSYSDAMPGTAVAVRLPQRYLR